MGISGLWLSLLLLLLLLALLLLLQDMLLQQASIQLLGKAVMGMSPSSSSGLGLVLAVVTMQLVQMGHGVDVVGLACTAAIVDEASGVYLAQGSAHLTVPALLEDAHLSGQAPNLLWRAGDQHLQLCWGQACSAR